MRITALSGGVGGARFLSGLLDAATSGRVELSELTVIANTADDLTLHGLRVCPDLDTVMYTLGGGIHPAQGWGRAQESMGVAQELLAYGQQPEWFTLGDKDLATHIVRTRLLGEGHPLSRVTDTLAQRWGLSERGVRLVPMSDDRVETHVVIDDPDTGPQARRAVHFQEWWVRLHAAAKAHSILAVGMDAATPAPGVLEAITDTDLVLLPPSNPVVSIGMILGVPGVRDALRSTSAPVVGVSPIIGGAPVRGMADACLRTIGVPTTAAAVAGLYADFLDAWLVAPGDESEVYPDTVEVHARPLLMSTPETTATLAAEASAVGATLARQR